MNEHDGTGRGRDAQQILERLLGMMGFEGKVDVFDQGEEVLLHIESADAGRLIGRAAQVLEALQIVVNRMMPHQEPPVRYVVDVERYRERRKDRLLKMALDAAEEVEKTGRNVRLPPMNSAERRIVHQALKENSRVSTHSEETGDEGKCVVVSPASQEPA